MSTKLYSCLICLLGIPLLGLSVASSAHADERLKGIACRSVHLGYSGSGIHTFYNQVRVINSAPGSYFMVCGWNRGYFGIQELANGKKVILFSVWDSSQGDDPDQVDRNARVEVLHEAQQTIVKRFGGEGTGGQCLYPFDWQLNTDYEFVVHALPGPDRTLYSGYFFDPQEEQWLHLVTFSTPTGGQELSGLYSFVEDFKRDRASTKSLRHAEFGPGWTHSGSKWQPIVDARFTADSNPVLNIDAGLAENRFYLATGGTTINRGFQLRQKMELPQVPSAPPEHLLQFRKPDK